MLLRTLLSSILVSCLATQDPVGPPALYVAAKALGIELEFAAAGRLPDGAQQERVIALTDGDAECLAGSRIVQVRYRWPRGRWQPGAAALVPCALPAAPKAPWSVLLIAGDDGQMTGGAVLDGDGKLAEAWRGFGEQFAGKDLPSFRDAVSRREVAQRLAELAAGKDAEARAGHALAAMRTDMLRQAIHISAVMEALETGVPVPELAGRIVEDSFAAMAGRAEALAPWFGKTATTYGEQAKAAAELVAAARTAKPDATDGKQRLRELRRSCASCHELTGETFQGELATASAAKRRELGLGDRPFVLGHDVLLDFSGQPQPIGEVPGLLAPAFHRAALLLAALQDR